MKKILLACGAGASSGFLAQKMRQYAKENMIDVEVKAISESEIEDYLEVYDIVFIGPHLSYKFDDIEKKASIYKIPVEIIDKEVYSTLDGAELIRHSLAILEDSSEDSAYREIYIKENNGNRLEDTEDKEGSKIMNWMTYSFAPKMNKITNNKFIKAIQDSIMTIMPFIMVGSIISIINIFKNWLTWIPDLSLVSTFTFGMMSLYLAFLIPYKVMDNYRKIKYKFSSSLTSVSLYLLLILPVIDSEKGSMTIVMDKLGAGGMLISLFVGVMVSMIMLVFSKFSFFKKDTNMPDIVVTWTDSIVPVALFMIFGVVIFRRNIDIYQMIQTMFSPIFGISQTLPGIIICSFTVSFLYSFGISSWAIFPITWTIWMQGVSENTALIQMGQNATNLNTMEFFHGFIYLGGVGTTLVLAIMMLFSKSKRLKALGKVTIIPSLFNINEPLIFGTVAFNPLLMVPMWINSIIIPTISYFAFKVGLVSIPKEAFQVWYLPAGIFSYFATQDVRSFILIAINLIVAGIIYYVFFKVYENQQLELEKRER